ncbi:MAG TPA: hypothetical protein VHC49_20055 [Mycobacteriales bacterium]|nr:hypothetical protein [Mycobacteriales bacterium]
MKRLAATAALLAPIASEVRIARSSRLPSEEWQRTPVEPRRATALGISFRPLQAESFGLAADSALESLLQYPFEVIRLAAYWNRIEPKPGAFCTDEIDWQLDCAERAGKQVILSLGPIKNFGYPEYFVPDHILAAPLPEGTRIEPADHPALLESAADFLARLVQRYSGWRSIIAWQIEHDAVDPLGMEHSWRLSKSLVRREIEAVRTADPTRPILLNGFLPTSTAVRVQQWWRTRDQGDSLDVAGDLADVVGLDFYPRHALFGIGPVSVYLDGSRRCWQQRRRQAIARRVTRNGGRLLVSEGQAEPWEAVTTPPSPARRAMYSCPPEKVIDNYNQCMQWGGITTYLFWGAEYWLLRNEQGDPRYLKAFERVLSESAPDSRTSSRRQ